MSTKPYLASSSASSVTNGKSRTECLDERSDCLESGSAETKYLTNTKILDFGATGPRAGTGTGTGIDRGACTGADAATGAVRTDADTRALVRRGAVESAGAGAGAGAGASVVVGAGAGAGAAK